MNGKKARAIRRAYSVQHVRQARLWRSEIRAMPRWLGGYVESIRRRIEAGEGAL